MRVPFVVALSFALSACSDKAQDKDAVDADADGDGHPSPEDCDDADATIHPGAEDALYDGIDSDCSGGSDGDGDGDGFDWDGVGGGTDCDDTDAAIRPDAAEICNGVDDNCDGAIDGDDATDKTTFYQDGDGDGHGITEETSLACVAPEGYAALSDDCDDENPDVFPAAAAVPCDGIDNDCDPATEEPSGALLDGVFSPDVGNLLLQATTGDTVYLCEGRLTGSPLLVTSGIDLQGFGYQSTVLDAGGAGSALVVATSEPVEISGITLTGGAATEGGGLSLSDGADVTATDLHIEGNRAGLGGGIWVGAGARLSLTGSTISANTGDNTFVFPSRGGGIASGLGALMLFDEVFVQLNQADLCGGVDLAGGDLHGNSSSEIVNNESIGLTGGGLCAGDVSYISGWYVARNVAETSGGGAHFTGTIDISATTFEDNVAGVEGGGILAEGADSRITITSCVVTTNSITYAPAQGGGVAVDEATIVSTSTDWGDGATDNVPADVALLNNNESYGYPGLFSFTCYDTPGSGTCE